MISYKTGNIFDQDLEAIVNPVNCIGIAGKGLALKFKVKYPDNQSAYEDACKFSCIELGKVFTFKTGLPDNPKYIINFPTKNHWMYSSDLKHIQTGLQSLYKEIITRGIESIAMPMLGCGLGGLPWDNVKKLIEGEYRKQSKEDKVKLEKINIVVMENLGDVFL